MVWTENSYSVAARIEELDYAVVVTVRETDVRVK